MDYEPTLVLEEGYLETPRDEATQTSKAARRTPKNAEPASGADVISTRVISREMVLDGAQFNWWAIGERPCLVTVRSALLGSKAEFTRGDAEEFATKLAKQLLTESYERRARHRREPEERPPTEARPDVLRKPGWFGTEGR